MEWVLFLSGACFGASAGIVAMWFWSRFNGLIRTKEEWMRAHGADKKYWED